jgi:hypothetical protein
VRFISTAVLLVFLVAPMVQAEGVAAPDAAPAAVDDAADADAGDVGAAEGTGNEDTGPEVRPPPPPVDEELVKPFGTADIVKSLLRTTLMLAVVLGIVWLTLSKGMGKLVEKANAGKRVKVIERVALDARRSLFLVEVDETEGSLHELSGGCDCTFRRTWQDPILVKISSNSPGSTSLAMLPMNRLIFFFS